MFDDLDDLLEDVPLNKNSGAKNQTGAFGGAGSSSALKSKVPAAFGGTGTGLSSTNKKKPVEDEFDEFDFDLQQKSKSSKPAGGFSGSHKQNTSEASFGGGFGASKTGLRKEEKKNEEWDDWNGGADNDKSVNKSQGYIVQKDEGRSSLGSYTGFGVLGKQKTTINDRPTTSFSGNRRKRGGDDDDDDLDNIISDIASKKGVEISKPLDDKRPNTAAPKATLDNRNNRFKSSLDPWDRDNFDELEDQDDAKSKKSQGAALQNQMSEKRKALFGLGPTKDQTIGDAQSSQLRGNNTSKSVGRAPDNPIGQNAYGGYLPQGNSSGNQDQILGTGGNLSGSQDGGSQIGVLELENSRSKQLRRMPSKPIQDAPGQQPQPVFKQQQSNSQGRPPTGNAQTQQNTQFQFASEARVQSSPIGMIQTQNTGNFSIAPFQRPTTGGGSGGFGKPPKHSGMNYQEEPEQDNVLDLLGDSKDRSYKGSQASQGPAPAYFGSIEQEEDANQFERFDEGGDDEGSQSQHSGDDDDDEDFGSSYQPTSLVRAGYAPPQPKKKKAQKKSNVQSKNQSHGSQQFAQQANSLGASTDKNIDLNASERKAQTIGSEVEQQLSKNTTLIQIQQQQYTQFQNAQLVNSIGSQQTVQTTSQHQTFNVPPNFKAQTPQPLQPVIDEKTIIQRQIDDERQKQKLIEDRQRKYLDEQREDHKRNMKGLEEKQLMKMSLYNEEKRKLIEDMNKTIELEKDKLQNLHKIDVDNRELQYRKNLDNQKHLYEDQHSSLKNQLEQQVQMNTFAQEIQRSSGSINQLVSKLSAEQEGEIKRREDELQKREKVFQERKKALAERKQQAELRKKKLQIDFEDIQHRSNESKLDFEREKNEVQADVDRMDLEHQQNVREIRNKTIELEVDVRRTKAEREKILAQNNQEEKSGEDKLEELAQQKKQLLVEKEDFRNEVQYAERELKNKLREVREKEKEIEEEEYQYLEREKQFDVEQRKVNEDHEALQAQVDKYCIEREQFDRDAQKIKEQGERDQIDSEKIGFFKANKDRLRDELRQLREDLEQQRETIREDRIKLEMYKNELKTRQKTIETIRYDYIKNTQDSQSKFLDDARDLGFYNLQRYAGGPTFYPINPPAFEQRKENIAPNSTVINNSSTVHVHNRSQSQNNVTNQNQPSQPVYDSYIPRFNYDQYMRSLKEKLAQNAPVTNSIGGYDFQMYIIKEREAYMKGLHDFDPEQPLIQSLSHFRSSQKRGEDIGNNDPSFNLGSLQNSQYDKNGRGKGLLNSQVGKSSVNSLHFISKNFSNSPVEEVDKDKEESHLYL